ncbi:MAG: glycosyltransferase family 4 protein [Candidatus Moranbacteria bacterium]|nr:glycosyltransferase family 4 protein [Candidatus Moranbacteria bacterium]
MKILVIAPTPFFADRGTHIRILEESLALEKRGHQITIATYHIGRDIHSDVETNIDVRRIRRLLFWYKKLEAGPDWQKIFLDIMLIRKAFYLARTQRPDVIHGHLHEGVLIGWIVKKALFWRKMKLVADFHGSLTKEMASHSYLKGGILKKIFFEIEKWIDNLGDAALSSSEENTKDISKIRADHSVATVLDGVNLSCYESFSNKDELKREYELPTEKTIITYAGALIFNKGIEYLMDAIPKVLEKNDNVYFVVAGFPVEDVTEFVRKNNLSQSVRIVSPLNYFDLPKLLSASDIGVDPKDSMTLQASGKILQYMAAGLPVVCFDRPNNRAYLGEGGEYAREISAESLADSILSLANEPQKIQYKGQLNKQQIKKFSWDISAQKIEETYLKNDLIK